MTDRDRHLDPWLPEIYRQLRHMAGGFLARERRAHTLEPTALVHEACLRLLNQQAPFNSPTHLQAVAATAMRRILVDHARKHRSAKHGGTGSASPCRAPPAQAPRKLFRWNNCWLSMKP